MSIKSGSDAFSLCYYVLRDAFSAIFKPVPLLGSSIICSMLATLSFPVGAIAALVNLFAKTPLNYPLSHNGVGWVYFALKGHHLNSSRFNQKFRKVRAAAITKAIRCNDIISIISLIENEGFWWEDYICSPDILFNLEAILPSDISPEAFNILLGNYESFRSRHPSLPISSTPMGETSPLAHFALQNDKTKVYRLINAGAPFSICRVESSLIHNFLRVVVNWDSETLLAMFEDEAQKDSNQLIKLCDASLVVSNSAPYLIQCFIRNINLIQRDVELLNHLSKLKLLEPILDATSIASIINLISESLSRPTEVLIPTLQTMLGRIRSTSMIDDMNIMRAINDEASRLESEPLRPNTAFKMLWSSLLSVTSQKVDKPLTITSYLLSIDELTLADLPFSFYKALVTHNLVDINKRSSESLFAKLLLVHPDRLNIYNYLRQHHYGSYWPTFFIKEGMRHFCRVESRALTSIDSVCVRLRSRINPCDRLEIERILISEITQRILTNKTVHLFPLVTIMDGKSKPNKRLSSLVYAIINSRNKNLIEEFTLIANKVDHHYTNEADLIDVAIVRCLPDDIKIAESLVKLKTSVKLSSSEPGHSRDLYNVLLIAAAGDKYALDFIDKNFSTTCALQRTVSDGLLAKYKTYRALGVRQTIEDEESHDFPESEPHVATLF